jgi:hypothetical protein
MLRNLLIISVLFLGLDSAVNGQTNTEQKGEINDEGWTSILEEMAEEGLESREWGDILSELHENPIPLNESNQEMLESIPFLSEYQIESLAYYLFRYAPMVSMNELLLVDGFNEKTRKWIQPFVCLGKTNQNETPVSTQKIIHYGKQTFRTTFGLDLNEKWDSKDTTNGYMGNLTSVNLRYEFNYKNRYQFGILIDKDPGEDFWNSSSKKLDRLSIHLVLKNLKSVKNLILGEYTLCLGQGLTCNNNFCMGKGSLGISPEYMGSTIKRHFSSSISPFFQGVITQINLLSNKVDTTKKNPIRSDITLFLSTKKIDSNAENGVFSSIYYTGLHRSTSELITSSNLEQKVLGGRINMRTTNIEMGFNFIETLYNANRGNGAELWKYPIPNSNSFNNTSVDLRTHWHNLQLYSEIAFDQQLKMAAIGGFSVQASSRLQLSALYRFYDKQFHSEFGNAFAEGGKVNNEEGFFMTIAYQPFKEFMVKASCDIFRFPWLRQLASAPSEGTETCLQLEKAFGSKKMVILRIKTKLREETQKEENVPIRYLISTSKNQARLTYSTTSSSWNTKITIEMNQYSILKTSTYGWALAQDMGYLVTKGFGIYTHLCIYQTDTYNNRIYLYERSIPGSFSIPMLYGEGLRNSIYVRLPIGKIQTKLKYNWKSNDPPHSRSQNAITVQLSRKI